MKNKNKWVEEIYDVLYEKSVLSGGIFGVRVLHEDGWPIDKLVKLITQTRQDTLEWCLKEVVEGDEGYTGNNDFHMAHTRDELRKKQRQIIKNKMEGKK